MKNVTTPAQKVFIVSGDPGLRHQLHSLITTRGVHCVSLKSAAEYRHHCKTDTAACLLLDVNLTDMNGLDLQEQIVERRLASPPAITVPTVTLDAFRHRGAFATNAEGLHNAASAWLADRSATSSAFWGMRQASGTG